MSVFMQGLQIMVVGIFGVFVFLIVLVIATNLSGKVLARLERFFPEPQAKQPSATLARSSDIEIAVAIAAAKTVDLKE